MEGALWGAFSAAVFFGIGQHFSAIADANAAAVQGGELEASKLVLDTGLTAGQFAAQSISHGIAGGTIAEMQGGKFGHGFLSAGLSKAATPKVMSLSRDTFAQGAMLAIVGGGISRVSGGKFANGEATAAMAFAFNQCATGEGCGEADATEDSLSASITAKLHERLRAGIFVDQGDVRVIFRLPVGKEFSLTVNKDGVGEISVGDSVLTVNDRGIVDGIGVNVRSISLSGRVLNSREFQFTGQVSIPLFANRVALSLGLTRSIDVESALLKNSGGLGQVARASKGRTKRLDRAICEQSGSDDC